MSDNDIGLGVYSLPGDLLLPKSTVSQARPTVDIRTLRPGTYLLKVDAKKTIVVRFVKK